MEDINQRSRVYANCCVGFGILQGFQHHSFPFHSWDWLILQFLGISGILYISASSRRPPFLHRDVVLGNHYIRREVVSSNHFVLSDFQKKKRDGT